MTGKIHKSLYQAERRLRTLLLLAVACGAGFGILGFVLEGSGSYRATFSSIAIVVLAAAGYCASAVWLEPPGNPPVDLEEPPAEPQWQVALIHCPDTSLKNALEAVRDEPRT